MRRYITRIDPGENDYEPIVPHLTVYEREEGPVYTGLLDANGTKLYRVDDREPIGFRPRASR